MGFFDKFLGKRPPTQSEPPPIIPPRGDPPPLPTVQTQEVNAHPRRRAENLYHKGARLILIGIRLRENKRMCEGLELLVPCEDIAPDFIEPLKLYYRVVWSRMPKEERDKAIFIERHRHITPEKTEFLDRLEKGLESFEERPELWQEFVGFVEDLPETKEIRKQAKQLSEEAARWIEKGLEKKFPPALQKAFQRVREAMKLDPENLDAWKLYCRLTFAMCSREKREEMISEEQRFATSEENSAKLQFLEELISGKHLLHQPNTNPSSENIRRGKVLFEEGERMFRSNQYEVAIGLFDQVLAVVPRSAAALHNKGLALGRLGRTSEAKECFNEAIRIDPNILD